MGFSEVLHFLQGSFDKFIFYLVQDEYNYMYIYIYLYRYIVGGKGNIQNQKTTSTSCLQYQPLQTHSEDHFQIWHVFISAGWFQHVPTLENNNQTTGDLLSSLHNQEHLHLAWGAFLKERWNPSTHRWRADCL